MKRLILFTLSATLLFSCKGKQKQVKEENQTPEALTEESIVSDYKLYGRSKYGGDIIQRLFNEALEKNPELRALDQRIQKVRNQKHDASEEYIDYTTNNEAYWSALESYLSRMNDTTLSQQLINIFDRKKIDYKSNLAPLEKITSEIESQLLSIEDKEIVLKLVTTSSMMDNYRRNELPDDKPLKALKSSYDSLIRDIEANIKSSDLLNE